MTELLEKVIAELRRRPDKEQDEAATVLLQFLFDHEGSDYVLTPEQQAEVDDTIRGLENGTVRLLTDEEVEDMWRRLGV